MTQGINLPAEQVLWLLKLLGATDFTLVAVEDVAASLSRTFTKQADWWS